MCRGPAAPSWSVLGADTSSAPWPANGFSQAPSNHVTAHFSYRDMTDRAYVASPWASVTRVTFAVAS